MHAAHRLGIVHRDLKPGNVMVQRNPDGEWTPWVVDFGLARETVDRSRPTSPPAWWARRVHGAGAGARRLEVDRSLRLSTAWARRCSRCSPIGRRSGGSSVEVLHAGDVRGRRRRCARSSLPCRSISRPSSPSVWSRIPTRRYDSARALAEDLGRFLDGEPILARPLGFGERMARRLKRHRALVTLSAAALVALLAVGTLWLRSLWGAREQARLAQQFGGEAQAIENLMRVAHLLPAHDIRPDKAAVRARMQGLAETMKRGGAAAEGPGHYALGRGALALGDMAEARTHLERAWSEGYRAPEVAYALGQVLGAQYQQALEEVTALEIKEQREKKRALLAKELRDPALAYLRAGRSAATESSAFVEGEIALREERFDDALERLAQAQRDRPSLYEARKLTGETYALMAKKKRDVGDADAAITLTARAAEAYQSAGEVARSDETIHVGECKRRFDLLVLDWNRGRGLDRSADEALAVCERALVIDPDCVAAYRQESAIWSRVGEAEARSGKDPRPTFQKAVARAEEALKRDPRDVYALTTLGTVWVAQADSFEAVRGIDPHPSLQKAIEIFDRAIAVRPTAFTFNDLANAHSSLGDWENQRSGDPRPDWQRAIENYQRSLALAPEYSDAQGNLGTVLNLRGYYEGTHGVDPRPTMAEAVAVCEKAIALQPDSARNWLHLGNAWGFRAEWERTQGIDCRPSTEQRIRCYKKAIELKPDYLHAYLNFANLWHLMGLQALDHGQDPSEFVKEGRAHLATASKLNPNDGYSYQLLARLELIAARSVMKDATAAARFTDAMAAISKSQQIGPKDPDAREVEAEIHRWHAESNLLRHESPSQEIARGLDAAARALAINPKMPEALAEKGTLLRLRGADGDLAESKAALELAFQLNALLKHDYR